MLRKTFVFLAASLMLLSFSWSSLAQSGKNAPVSIKAAFIDASTSEAVPFVTVSVTKKNEKSPYKYVLSTNEGKALLEKVAAGEYTFKAELMGYQTYSKEIKISKENLDLGTIKLEIDSKVLDAASVSAVGNPIIMKKDTIEYNTSSFKTTENDMLEDLLKKLPGVEVGDDGSLTANGETITKVTIDGKTFFLDDPQLASKNIPAKIINKVKVVKKKSEQAEFTGIDDGNDETVIDLNIHKSMRNGLMGNIMAGIGHDAVERQSGNSLTTGNGDHRYGGRGFVGKFSDKTQISLILNGNNTNNRGFNDMSRNMMGGMRPGGGMGGGMGGGITTTWMAGGNVSTSLFDDKMDIGGNYMYSGSQNDIIERSLRTNYLDNRTITYDDDGYSLSNSDGHRFGMRLEHKFSEKTSIFFEPQVNFGTGSFSDFSKTATYTDYGSGAEKTNDGFNNTLGSNKNWTTSGFFLFRQRIGIPGRTMTFNVRYNLSSNVLNGYNQSLTSTYLDDIQRDSIINQRYERTRNQSSVTGNITYTEPLGNGFYVEGNYSIGFSNNNSFKDTYDSGSNEDFSANNIRYIPLGERLNDVYSSTVINRYVNQDAGVNLMYQNKKLKAQLGMGVKPTKTYNQTNKEVYKDTTINWAPRAMLWYDISDFTRLTFRYHGRSSQPPTSQLMAVPNNSNPLNISLGNPYLSPSFNHNLFSEFRYTNTKTFTSLNVGFNAGLNQNPIVDFTWYGANGAQHSMPVNGHNSGNANLRLVLNSPIAKSNFSFFIMSNAGYSRSFSYVGSTFDVADIYKDGIFDYERFHDEYPDLDKVSNITLNKLRSFNSSDRIRLTYRTNSLEVNVGGATRMSKSWYTVSNSQTDMTFNNQVNGSIQWTSKSGFELSTDLRYNWYNGYRTQQDPMTIVNAEISKLIFKRKATIALKAYDILNQSKTLRVNDSGNYHTESYTNALGRYVLLTFTYRFGTFGGKQGGRAGGGPGGSGGPGGYGRGMGMPPMGGGFRP